MRSRLDVTFADRAPSRRPSVPADLPRTPQKTGSALADLLSHMKDLEVLVLALDAYPDRTREIKSTPDIRSWMETNGDPKRILPKVPIHILQRVVESRQDGSLANPLSLDDEARKALFIDLNQMPGIIRSRARDYVDRITDLVWLPGGQKWLAKVRGTLLYSVQVSRLGDEDCDCRSCRDYGQCKHTAALRMRLLREFADLTERRSSSLAGSGSRDLTPEVSRSLDAIRRASQSLKTPERSPENSRQQVVYVLEYLSGKSRVREANLVPRSRTLPKGGEWRLDKQDLRYTQIERLRLNPPRYLSPTDIELILACGKVLESDWESTPTRTMSFHPLLARAFGTGRLMLPDGTSLQLDKDLWRLAPELEVNNGTGRFSFSLESLDSAASGSRDSNGRAPRISLHGTWTIFGEEGNWTVRTGSDLFRLDPRTPKALFSLAENLPALPLEVLAQVRAELRDLSHGGVVIPAQCLPPRLREAPKRCAVIELAGEDVIISAKIVYPSLVVSDDDTEELLAFTADDGSIVELERDLAAETRIVEDLDEALSREGVDKIACTGGWRIVDPASLRQMAVHGVPNLEKAGWDIRQAACLNRWKRRAGVLKMVGKDSGQDWFEVSGVVDFEGLQIPLSTLIARKGQIQLSDGSVGELSEALLKRLHWMEKLGTRTEDGIRLRKFQAVLAQEMVESGHAQVQDLTAWNRQLAKALNVDTVEVTVPASLQAALRPYQQTGLEWLVSLRCRGIGGILADDMGLGKTIQVIAHLCHLFELDPKAPPALVVGPATVVGNWISEFERFAPHLETRLLHGNDRDSLRDAPITGPTVFVTTYGILPREVEWMRSQEFSLLVLDESQAIRNPATVTHQCCVQLAAKQKLCLTGTPIENALSDLWAQFSFLNPGLLGPREEFLSEFTPDPGEVLDLSRLRMLTSPFWLRRTKREVAQDLPERSDILLNVELEAKQMALYQRQLKDYQKELLPQIKKKGLDSNGRFQVLTALLRLRQIACAPELAGHKGAAAKLDLLMEKIAEDLAEGHRMLVFSTFTSLLDLVGDRLRKSSSDYLRFDGTTPPAERTRLIKRFQTEKGASIFLISLKAGGAGVNLTAADTVFLLDPWWNPAAEEQAAARAHRIGQTRPVTLYRMVAKGTIEERVLALSRSKAALASDLFDAGVSGGASLTPEIVQELLG